MPPQRLLVVSGNVLVQALLESQRADAKRIFNAVSDGKRIALMKVRLDDDTEVRFDLALDHSEFRGSRFNFKAFRNSLAGLVQSLGENFRQETDVPVFTEQDSGAMLFAIPGITRDEDRLNVMMLSVSLREPGCVQLKLMYMDPDQFQVNPDASSAASNQDPLESSA